MNHSYTPWRGLSNILDLIVNGRPMGYGDGNFLMYRTAIVGFLIRNYKTKVEDFFDVDEVKDATIGNYISTANEN